MSRRPHVFRRVLALFAVPLLASLATAQVPEIVLADGRHEPVEDPRQDSHGRWMATREGRRTVLKPGEVVAIVDAAGKETVTLPELADAPDPPETAAALAALRDPKNAAWREATEQLGARPSRGILDALLALASDARKEMRSRAITALARLRTRESVKAATDAVLAEKDKGLRRDAASILFSVQEIFRRCDAKDSVAAGLADKDVMVRIDFAALSPAGNAQADAVLRNEGLKHADHHVREMAALELGLRGDVAAEPELAGMLARNELPGIDDPELMQRMLVREQVQICGIFAKSGTDTAKAALRKALSSPREAVRKAAEAALAAAAPPAK